MVRILLILAPLAVMGAAVSLLVSFPPTRRDIVAIALLFVALVATILAISHILQKGRRRLRLLEGNQETLLQLQGGIASDLTGLEGETRKLSGSFKQLSTLQDKQGRALTQLQEGGQELGQGVKNLAMAQENFRVKMAQTLQDLSRNANDQNGQLQNNLELLTRLEIINSSAAEIMQNNTSSLGQLHEKHAKLSALQVSNHEQLRTLLDQSSADLSQIRQDSQEKGKEQSQHLTSLSQGLSRFDERLHAAVSSMGQMGETSRSAAAEQLQAFDTLSKASATSASQLNHGQEEISQVMSSQGQTLTALDNKIGSQQKAVLAALRQVEYSHRPQGRLEGDLSKLALPDLLQILQLAKKTASIFIKEVNGAIYLEDGLLVYVRQGQFAGIQAFIRIMLKINGYFSVRFDTLPTNLPKKPRPLMAEVLTVLSEVDEINDSISSLEKKIRKESGLDSFLIQLPDKGIDPAVLATFNYQAPASTAELALQMGKGVKENIKIISKLHKKGQLTLIS
ncbi:MAG: DUF4388 domain-containing protein [Thermodesulfobacteriota bacterium]